MDGIRFGLQVTQGGKGMICDNCTTSFNPQVEGTICFSTTHGKKVIALCTSCSEAKA